MRLLLICNIFFTSICFADTNEINYINLPIKDYAQDRLENLYFLQVSKHKTFEVKLTGENLLDYNNFNSINRVRTYTTIKINF
jgi:hypothetical protein